MSTSSILGTACERINSIQLMNNDSTMLQNAIHLLMNEKDPSL
jgi:hypothetical protein